jgi:hypothetical protein
MSNFFAGNNLKVFTDNYLVSDTACTITASDGNVENMRDYDRSTRWEGTDSSWTIEFSSAKSINRIFLQGINWQRFQLRYWDGTAYTAFTGTKSFSQTSGGILFTSLNNNANSSLYFEFDEVSTTKILVTLTLRMSGTGTNYYISEFYAGKEIGTFIDDPASKPNSFEVTSRYFNSSLIELSNGGVVKYDRADKYRAKISMNEVWETADQTLINEMLNADTVAIYPCGGDTSYTQIGWRLDDFYHIVVNNNQSSTFAIGRDKTLGINQELELLER